MLRLTARQQQVLDLIKERVANTGMPPTRAEIATHFGFRSANAAEEHIKALAKKGAIELMPGASRGIRLPIDEFEGLPLVGSVAAGYPILAQENIEERYKLDASMFHPPADFLLRVQGMSMRDAGILNNDLLAVHRCPTANAGQIVVARIDDEVTVKRFERHENIVHLLPENPEFDPIKVNLEEQEIFIEGIAVGIIRNNGAL